MKKAPASLLVLAALLASLVPSSGANAASVSIDSWGAADIVEKTVNFTADECLPGLYAGMPTTSRVWLSFIRLPADRRYERLATPEGNVAYTSRSVNYGNFAVNFMVLNGGTVNVAGMGTGVNVRCQVGPIPSYTGPVTLADAQAAIIKGYGMLNMGANPFRIVVLRSEH
jgi:hypothetical protein